MNSPASLVFGLPPSAAARLQAVFAAWPQIESVWIYGSRAKGNYRPGSDIDLMVVAAGLSLSDRFRIEGQIDALDFPWTVDLALEADIDNPDLREHIARVGKAFYRRPSAGPAA